MPPPDDRSAGDAGRESSRGRWVVAAAGVWLAGTALSLYVHGLGSGGEARQTDASASRAALEDARRPGPPSPTPTARPGAKAPGPWIQYAPPPDERRGDLESMEEALRALGYLDAYEAAPSGSGGVEHHAPGRAQPGWNLLVSSHAPEAALVDMDGRERHRWHHPFAASFPQIAADPNDRRRLGWRRVHVFPNGDLLAIFEGLGLLKLDRDSRLLWALEGGYHHDLDVGPDGRIYALYREVKRIPRIHPRRPFLEDSLRILSPSGELLAEHSLLEALEGSRWAQFLTRQGRSGDLLHTNAVSWLDGSHAATHPAFARGNLLLSSLTLDLLFVIDPRSGGAPWALAGPWLAQHEPRLLENGHLLVFDNLGGASGSRVLEVDPSNGEIVWRYEDPVPEAFASTCCGTASRLDNGNTLIVDSTSGHAFEVTPAAETVWSYRNPHRRGSNRELVAVLFDVIRLPREFGAAWLVDADDAPAANAGR